MKNSQSDFFHFSIDDVFDSLIEVTDKNMPLKEHFFFSLLWEMWKKYGLRTGLHLFYQKELDGKLRTLEEVRDISEELNEGWIAFGPHAFDPQTPPYSQSIEEQKTVFDNTYRQIKRFAGNHTTKYVRLHFYSESFELAEYFKERGVEALFTTDKPNGSHRLPELNKIELLERGLTNYNNFSFIRTDFRIENLVNESLKYDDIWLLFNKTLKKYSKIIIYAHEYEFKRAEVCRMFEDCIKILDSLKLRNSIP